MILLRKLTLLAKLAHQTCNSCRIFQTLASKGDVFNISLIQQCRELEMLFGTKFIEQCLAAPENASSWCLVEADWKRTISMASLHPSLTHICSSLLVDEWMLLWDQALDYGPIGTRISQTIFKILSKPMFIIWRQHLLLLFWEHSWDGVYWPPAIISWSWPKFPALFHRRQDHTF